MTLYIIQANSGEYLDKHLVWSADTGNLFHTPHRDVALNQLIELNAKDVRLRARVLTCAADERGNPILDAAAA